MSDRTNDYRIQDVHTGRLGWALYRGGYLINGSYVNPYYDIRWDPEQEEADDETQ